MSPIYVRPEREQAEHDRLIRHLQTTYSQHFDAVANPGEERNAPVKIASGTHFPDVVLSDGKRVVGVVEVETAASVNNLETMAKWVPFSKARVPFYLYIPVPGYEAALRLAEAHSVKAAEIWTYRPASEGFDLVRMHVDPTVAAPKREPRPAQPEAAASKAAPEKKAAAVEKPSKPAKAVAAKPAAKAAKPAPKAAPKPAAKPVKAAAKAAKTTKPAAKAAKPAAKAARPAARKAPAKPVKPAKAARSARPAAKAAKKGTATRKKR